MRIPSGAPTTGWLRLQQAFPKLKKYKFELPPSGTLAIIGFLTVTTSFVTLMFIMPQYYKEYYQENQTKYRAAIGATNREELAQGLRPWSDPFDRDKKK